MKLHLTHKGISASIDGPLTEVTFHNMGGGENATGWVPTLSDGTDPGYAWSSGRLGGRLRDMAHALEELADMVNRDWEDRQ